jgi:hypothetical protein
VTRQQVGRLVASGALGRVPSPCGCLLVDEEQVRTRAAAPPHQERARRPNERPARARGRYGSCAAIVLGEVVEISEELARSLETGGLVERVE